MTGADVSPDVAESGDLAAPADVVDSRRPDVADDRGQREDLAAPDAAVADSTLGRDGDEDGNEAYSSTGETGVAPVAMLTTQLPRMCLRHRA